MTRLASVLLALSLCILVTGQARADREEAAKIYEQGYARLDEGKIDEAITLFEASLEEDPEFFPAEHGLGAAFARRKDWETAATHYRAAIRLKPDFPEAHNSLGVVLATMGRRIEAITAYEKALALKPKYTTARINLADALVKAGKTDQARAVLDKGLAQDPKSARVRVALASLAVRRKDSKAALEYLDDAIGLDPKSVDAFVFKGEILRALGQPERAVAAFTAATEIDEGHVRAWFLLGTVHVAERKWPAAAKAFARAEKLRPRNPDIAANRGIALLGVFGSTEEQAVLKEAIAAFERSLAKKPDQPEIAKLLASAKRRLSE